jgi:hypothetical protein
MNIIERAKKRKLVEPTVEVEFEGIIFTVNRFAPAEESKAWMAVQDHYGKEEIDTKKIPNEAFLSRFAFEKFKVLRPHITDWKPVEGKKPELSIDEVLDVMGYDEQIKLLGEINRTMDVDVGKSQTDS